MSTIEKLLYSPITFVNPKHVDDRYFKDNGDGTYTPTPLLVYNAFRDAEKFAYKKIMKLDTECQFHSESLREVKDTWAEKLHKDEWRAKYGAKTKEAQKLWEQYREDHLEEFDIGVKRVSLGGEDEARYFAAYHPEIDISLPEAVKMYNAAKECKKRFDKDEGDEYANLPFEYTKASKKEFAEKHKKIREEFSAQVGIPEDTFEVQKIEKAVKRINGKRCAALGMDYECFGPFVTGLFTYLTETTIKDYKEKASALDRLVTEDFIVRFNDSAREMKAVEMATCHLALFTKMTEYAPSIPLIRIYKDEPTDEAYQYIFDAELDKEHLHYSNEIVTVANLIKALKTTVVMIEDTNFKKYIPDLEHEIDLLETAG